MLALRSDIFLPWLDFAWESEREGTLWTVFDQKMVADDFRFEVDTGEGPGHGEEDEDVAFGLGRVNLEDGRDGGVKVVGFRLWCVEDLYGVATSRDCRWLLRNEGCME